MERFISKYGYIKPNSWDEKSENGLLFSVQYHYLLRDLNERDLENYWGVDTIKNLLLENKRSNNGHFRTLPHDNNSRFSLDNMCAIAGFSFKYGLKECLRSLPLFRRYSLRPDNFCYLLYCKFPFVGIWFLWITSIFMIISCLRAAPDRTSGPLLCYVKARGIDMKITWWICQKVIPMSFLNCFELYYPEPEHPIRVAAREVFK